MDAILSMKNELLPKNEVSDVFWEERNDWLKWILDQVYQTFDWQDLYPSIQEKAAALMYFTIKDHPFIDWNKKIWAFLLLIFLGKNKCLQKSDWTKVIDDDTLIALTLLVATSNPSERDMIIALIIHFINC
jgi:prophage maintenance system killer protein